MFTVFDNDRSISRRRALLTIGGLSGLPAMGLSSLLTRTAAAAAPHVTGRSVIYLFQQGGPSQLETFDPKPDAPSAVRTVTSPTQTRLPGVVFGEHMRQLSALADKLTVVRSFQTGNAGHNLRPLVGPDSLEANIGAHYARVVGATERDSGMPTTAVIYPRSVDEDVPRPQARGNLASTGPYSAGYAPFVPGGGGQLQKDLQLSIPRDRLVDDRQGLLEQLDNIKRSIDSSGQVTAVDELQQQAYQVLLGGGVTRALDLSQEDPRVLQMYDTSQYERKGQWNSVNRGRAGYYDANAACIGKLLLLARRLCEAGCGFVTIHAGYAGVWDMHADGNNLNMTDGMDAIGYAFDHAVAAFVKDVERRGLTDKILLVCGGEMGRTPRINKRGGRDHWARLAPLLLHGGGLPGGQVIGQSDRQGGQPLADPLGPKHLISTILSTVFDAGLLRLAGGVPDSVIDLASHPRIESV
ncbi:MAG: DUF1501 domain-containing protein [Pirellulaceae bacterium]|jgi:hypothetical protein|nr:DUF1501 domain-containing protein [Pirellulaceae bacterium]